MQNWIKKSFVREKANDENGNTLGYVFIGEANFRETEGSKPMSIKWELNEPHPIICGKNLQNVKDN
jgi:hypothetical protein